MVVVAGMRRQNAVDAFSFTCSLIPLMHPRTWALDLAYSHRGLTGIRVAAPVSAKGGPGPGRGLPAMDKARSA